MNPTEEQSAILDFIATSRSNLMIRAYAGCGKTSTLELIDRASSTNPKLLLCFNKAIAEEATRRMRPSTTVKTFNSLGHRIWAESVGKKLNLNPKKIRDIFSEIANAAPRSDRQALWDNYDAVTSGVNMARAIGYIPPSKSLSTTDQLQSAMDETPTPEAFALINKVLTTCIKQSYEGLIDFSDQVYMPALFAGTYPEFPMVLIDEYQDLSPINQAMVAKLCRRSRQIGVGDEAQAIYGFRGADALSMPNAVERFEMDVLPLSVSFRCPRTIVENVRWRVPDFKAFRDGGTISRSDDLPADDSAVICRNNAPLIKLAMKMVCLGHKVDVAGTDIGAKVIRQLSKLGPESLTQAQTLSAISDWEAERDSLDSKTAHDTAECMRVFALSASTLSGALAYARHLFAQSGGTIRFMTGHKAKGLEFDHVYHLDRALLTGREQDNNIHYVIDSRPKASLTYIESREN